MKVTINQNANIKGTEVIINCPALDCRVRNLAGFIQQYSASLEGVIDGAIYYVPLDSILYIDSVDRKTFFYDSHRIFGCQCTLAELEDKLEKALFVRISKNCIVNLAFVSRVCPYENHRMEVVMKSGEHLIAARSYKEQLRERLRDFNGDIFNASERFGAKRPLASYPECSVYNAGKVISFGSVPKRVIALSFENAEILAALGLAERLIAIAPAECGIDQVSPKYRESLGRVPLITYCDQGVPCPEELSALNPDLVLGNFFSLCTLRRRESDYPGSWEQNLYVMECTIPEKASMENYYKDLLNLGRIFRVEDRAVWLVEEMRRQVSVLTRRTVYQKPLRVFVYDGIENSPCTAAGGTLENDLISLAGGRNVFGHMPEAYLPVTWRQIAEALPEVILVHDYVDRMSAGEKIEMLQNREELRKVPAVRDNRFQVVSLVEALPGIQNVSMLEKLIRCFYPNLL